MRLAVGFAGIVLAACGFSPVTAGTSRGGLDGVSDSGVFGDGGATGDGGPTLDAVVARVLADPDAGAVAFTDAGRFTCVPGRGDCDSHVRNGCESFFDSDPSNCGRCHASCAAGSSCSNGACSTPDAGGAAGAFVDEPLPGPKLLQITGTGPRDVYVSGSPGIFHSTGDGNWTSLESVDYVGAVWPAPDGSLWCAFENPGRNPADTTCRAYAVPNAVMGTIWGNGSGDLWLGGNDLVHSGDAGATWQTQVAIPGAAIWTIAGAGRDVYALSISAQPGAPANGAILHTTDGATWTRHAVIGNPVALWVDGGGGAYVATNGELLRTSGGDAWVTVGPVPETGCCSALWGDATGLYAVGTALFRSADGGATWTRVVGTADGVMSMWGDGAGGLYLLGQQAVHHRRAP